MISNEFCGQRDVACLSSRGGGRRPGTSRRAQEDDETALAEARAALEGAKRGLEATKAAEESDIRGAPAPLPGADGSLGPSAALVNSPRVRRAADVLLRLARGPNGKEALAALADRTCAALESGSAEQASADVAEAEANWTAAGVPPAEAKAALGDLRALMDPTSGLPATAPDRAALLLALDYDQKPDTCRKYLAILDVADPSEAESQGGMEFSLLDPQAEQLKKELETTPGIRDATRFVKRLELIPSGLEQVRSRLSRLRTMPLVGEAEEIAAKDEDLRELMEAMEPFHLRLYNATRTAQLRTKKGNTVPGDRKSVV